MNTYEVTYNFSASESVIETVKGEWFNVFNGVLSIYANRDDDKSVVYCAVLWHSIRKLEGASAGG